MANCDSNKNINKTFVIEPLELTAGTPTITACTGIYTSKIIACSGDTSIEIYSGLTFNGYTLVNDTLSAVTVDASTIMSGGTNILEIIDASDTFVTGSTYDTNSGVLTISRNDGVDLTPSGFTSVINHTVSGSSTKSIAQNDMYLIWDDFTINSGSTVNNNGRLVVVNGDFNNFGSYSGSGSLELITTNLEYILNHGNETNGNLIFYTQSPSGWASGDSISDISAATGNVLVTKEWVELATSVDNNDFVTGATFTNNQLNITLNNGTSVETTIDNLSGLTVDGNVLINGDVNIIGSATTINSEQVLIKDNIITLNSNVTGSTTPILNSGFEVLRGSGDTKSILWLENTDLWSVDDDLSVSGYVSGTTYYGDGSNLTGIGDTFVTGGTYSGSTIILNRSDNNSVSVTGITSDNIANANLTFDGTHTADIDGYGWQLKDSTGANRILLDIQQGFGSTHGIGYGGAAIANQHTFYNIGGTNQLCSFSNLNGLKLTGDNGDYLNFGSAGFVLQVKPSTAYGAIIGVYPDIVLRTKHSSQGVIFDTNNYVSFKKNTVQHSLIDSSSRWILRGSAVVGSEKISLQDDTLIKGSDNSASTSGFKFTDVNNNSLLDIRNNGATTFSATVNANAFVGDGSGLTNLPSGPNTFVTGGTYSGSTIILNRNDGNSVDVTGITSSSIYTADGTLTGDRILSLSSNDLTFNGTGLFKISNGSKSVYPNWNVHSAFNIDNGNGTVWTLYNANASSTFNANEFGIGVGSSIPFRIFNNTSVALGGVGKSSLDTNYSVQTNGNTLIGGNIDAKSGTNLLSFDFANYSKIKIGTSTSQWWFVNSNAGNSSTFDDNDLYLWDSTNSRKVVRFNANGSTELLNKVDLSTTTDGFLMPRLTTAQMNAISSPDTDLLVFNTDLDCVMRYNGTAWTTFDSPKYIVRSGGTNTPYSNFKTAVDDAPAGAVLEVHTSEVIDVGMPSTYWDWTKDLTIQTNGHDVIMTNLSRIQIAAASNLNTLNIIGGGTFSSSHNQVFTIYRNLTINSDGATNIVSTATNGILFQPISNVAGTTFTVNNVKSVGVYYSFTRNLNLQHYTTLNNCHVDLTNSTTGASIINYKRITANNCTFKHTGGRITYPQNSAFPTVIEDEAFIFNNCTTVGNYGRCMLRLNNCSITTITTTNSGIYQVTLEANNTSFRNINTGSPSNLQGFAITASSELVILKNCTINSDWGGVYLAGVSSVINGCIIKSGNSWGVFRYNSGANISNFLTIKNSTIESGNYRGVGTSYGNLGKQFDISNTTIITSGTSHTCLHMNTGTHARFDNLKLKNLATPANILNRADLLTENPQINTLDNLGNIVLA